MRHLLPGLFGFILLAGCAVNVPTDPGAFDVQPDKVKHLQRGKEALSLVNGYSSEAKANLRLQGGVTWVVDQGRLTDTAIIMLTRALEKQGIEMRDQSPKSVALQVQVMRVRMVRHPFSPIMQTTATVALQARFGDGTASRIEAENMSPMGGQRAFDGAVLFALNDLLEDEKFVAYMNR
jgi:hypothetical protein